MRQVVVLIIFWLPVIAIFIDPFYGVLHYTLSSIIRPEQLMWGDPGAAERIFLVIQAFAFVSWVINRQKLVLKNTRLPFQVKLLWCIGFCMLISTYYATDPEWSWMWTSTFLKMTILCFVISKSFNTAKKVEWYYTLSLIWFSFLAIWGFLQKLGGNIRMEKLGGTQLPDVNTLSAVYVMFFPIAYYTIFSRNRLIKNFVGIPSTIIFIIFIMFGESRGAFLGMAACMGLIFLRAKGTQKIRFMFTGCILFILLAIILSIVAPKSFFESYLERLATMQADDDTGQREESAQSRFTFWKTALFVYQANPQYWFKGVGMFCYARTYRKHIDQLSLFLEPEEYDMMFGGLYGEGWEIHDTYLDVLLGGGLMVFIPWITLIFYSWFQSGRIPGKYPQIIDGVDIHNYAHAVEIGIVGYCVCIIFITLTFNDFFYWHLTMVGVLKNLAQRQLQREEIELDDAEFLEH